MSVVVFLGPTLPHDEARKVLDATYLPPVAMGDVWALLRDPPRAIVIIDGVFEGTPAVWHKEILYALSRGVRVFGASSMGALRAAELEGFGMEGVGRIFEMYRDGVIEDDDDVAVIHGPAEHGFRAMSDAMVNIRHGLAQAEARGAISARARETLTAHAKSHFYGDRSWAALLQPGIHDGVPDDERERLRAYLRAERPDLKRSDALAVLEHVRAIGASAMPPHEPTFTFEESFAWRSFLHRETRVGADGTLSVASLGRHVRATMPEREDILRGAALLAALAGELELAGSPAPTTMEAIDHACDVKWRHQARVDRYLPLELQRRGLLGRLVEEARDTLAAGDPADEAERARASAWYEERHGGLDGVDLDDHARGLRFASWTALLDDVVRALRAKRGRSR